MENTKKWYVSRTVWVNALVIVGALVGVIQEWLVAGDFSPIGMTFLATGIINLALRFVTSESIG